jgi:hypothetical protein
MTVLIVIVILLVMVVVFIAGRRRRPSGLRWLLRRFWKVLRKVVFLDHSWTPPIVIETPCQSGYHTAAIPASPSLRRAAVAAFRAHASGLFGAAA